MKSVFFYETEIGKIGISGNGETITGLFFACNNEELGITKGLTKGLAGDAPIRNEVILDKEVIHIIETPLIKKAAEQLKEYLAGKRKEFDIQVEMAGTPFQKLVWKALMNIPYGETRSYKEIAECIGNPMACRAVGMANNKNPIAVIVPCHRVIGSNGRLVGYAGGMDLKKKLLELERRN